MNLSGAETYGAVNPFSFTTSLAAGGTIDFLVAGVSDTQDQNSLSTGFNATITSGTVPEPGTWAMMLVGVGMIAGGLRLARRKNGLALTGA
jgi:hypothetical protein